MSFRFASLRCEISLGMLLGACTLGAHAQTDDPAPPSSPRDEILAAVRAAEKSVSLLEYRLVAFPAGADGKRVRSRNDYTLEIHAAFGPAGERYYKSLSYDGDRKLTNVTWSVDDGARAYEITTYDGLPDAIVAVEVRDRPDVAADAMRFPVMDTFLWLIWPEGWPLSKLIERAKSFERDPQGKVDLTAPRRRGQLDVRIDPASGWMPQRISINQGAPVISALSFRSLGGRWFPNRGTSTDPDPDAYNPYEGFELVDLKVNDPSTRELFRPPPPIEGVSVFDHKTRRITSQPGGKPAYDRLMASYAAQAGEVKQPVPPEAIPSADPPGFPWGYTVMAAGAVTLVLAWRLAARRS